MTFSRQLSRANRLETRELRPAQQRRERVSSQAVSTVGRMFDTAIIRILCEANPSFGTAVVDGLLAWATMLGGGTALGGGLLAALIAFDTTKADLRADLINRGMGAGFMFGAALGLVTFVLFAARIVS